MSNDNKIVPATEEEALAVVEAVMGGEPLPRPGPIEFVANEDVECCGSCDAYYEGACTVNGPTPIALQQQRKNIMGQIETSVGINSMVPPMMPHQWCVKWTAKRHHLRAPQPAGAGGGKPNGSAGRS